jgi:hypothetical protein
MLPILPPTLTSVVPCLIRTANVESFFGVTGSNLPTNPAAYQLTVNDPAWDTPQVALIDTTWLVIQMTYLGQPLSGGIILEDTEELIVTVSITVPNPAGPPTKIQTALELKFIDVASLFP